MKKLIIISLLILTSCESKFKYSIIDKNGDVYLCNFYTKSPDGCVMFNDKPGIYNTSGYPTRLCGDYEINKLK